jgi:hypothetical protein
MFFDQFDSVFDGSQRHVLSLPAAVHLDRRWTFDTLLGCGLV